MRRVDVRGQKLVKEIFRSIGSLTARVRSSSDCGSMAQLSSILSIRIPKANSSVKLNGQLYT